MATRTYAYNGGFARSSRRSTGAEPEVHGPAHIGAEVFDRTVREIRAHHQQITPAHRDGLASPSDQSPGVLIGGTAPAEVKERLRDAIQQVLPARLPVRVALPTELFGGDDPNNIVNRLSPCGGIQIEQGPSPREDHGRDIAEVVADCFRPPTTPP